MCDEAYRVRLALDVSETGKKKLTARIAKLRAAGATLSKLPFDEAAHACERTQCRRTSPRPNPSLTFFAVVHGDEA